MTERTEESKRTLATIRRLFNTQWRHLDMVERAQLIVALDNEGRGHIAELLERNPRRSANELIGIEQRGAAHAQNHP